MNFFKNLAVRSALVFFFWSVIWIFTSDQLVLFLETSLNLSHEGVTTIQSLKGIFYVTVTTLIMYFGIQRGWTKIEAREREYRDFFIKNPSPMFIFDLDTYKFIEANDAILDKLGYSKRELLTLTIFDIRPEEDYSKIKNGVKENDERISDKGHWRYKRKDGSVFWVHVFSRHTQLNNKLVMLVIAMDVNEKVLAEEKVMNKNKALREIAWFQSHQLRAPIARILGLSSLMNYENPADKENMQLFQHLKTSVTELDQVIKEIVIKAAEES